MTVLTADLLGETRIVGVVICFLGGLYTYCPRCSVFILIPNSLIRDGKKYRRQHVYSFLIFSMLIYEFCALKIDFSAF